MQMLGLYGHLPHPDGMETGLYNNFIAICAALAGLG
jgi:hypothetical protein